MDALLTLLKERRNGISSIVFLLVAVFLMFSVRSGSIGFRAVQEAILDVVGPVQRVLLVPWGIYQETRDALTSWVDVHEDNHLLREALTRERVRRGRLEELVRENRRLRGLLAMPVTPGYPAITAQTIGSASSAFARTIVLNAGRIHGVTVNAPVVAIDGLVGRVVTAGRRHAVVLTLLDLNSRAPVMIQRNRIAGIVRGANDRWLELAYIPKEEDVRLGDRVITSGTGGVFPKGLVVGEVTAVEPEDLGLFQRVIITPAVDFDRLEEARLLLSPAPEAVEEPPAPEPSPASPAQLPEAPPAP